ncbi:hypothetical protein [Stieleria tagensis]|uniref:hypothetical protein n=1 Tax=Stieleria tagensis TaxID=2956795 RepID=UPI00209B8D66|nr:hypothetical protein [Stieleria tagensis]
MKIIASGPSDAPSFPTSSTLFEVCEQIEDLQQTHADYQAFEQFDVLNEYAIILRTLGNILASESAAIYISERLHEAQSLLDQVRELGK